VRTFRSAAWGRPHGEEETAELAKTAEKTSLSDLGVLRGSFVSGRPEGLHYTGLENALRVVRARHVAPFVEASTDPQPFPHRASKRPTNG
jgi:hypothetical protein